MNRQLTVFACAALASGALHAQTPTAPALPGGTQEPQAMMAAMQAAQAEASRPGDEKLTCEELEAELGATVNDPKVQANIAAGGAAAERDMAALAEAKRAYDAQLPASVAAGVATSAAPGGQYAAMGKAVAEAESKKGIAAERLKERASLAAGAMEMMPQLMRGQRIIELGTARGCEFAKGAGLDGASQAVQ